MPLAQARFNSHTRINWDLDITSHASECDNEVRIELTDSIAHPVGIYARMQAKRSAIERLVKATTRHTAAISPNATTP